MIFRLIMKGMKEKEKEKEVSGNKLRNGGGMWGEVN